MRDDFAPRAVLWRETIPVNLTPFELSELIGTLQARAVRAAQHFDQVDVADFWFRRVAELREVMR